MSAVLEIAGRASTGQADAARHWCETVAVPHWTSLAGLTASDLYLPAVGRHQDPFVDDGPGPQFLIMLEFPNVDALVGAARSPDFAAPLARKPGGLVLSADAMERRFYPVAGAAQANPLAAPFSYSVRYHRPAEDEARFVDFYLANHPPLLGRLPGIRNVICYLPLLGIRAADLPSADYMLGNEVVFDTLDAFNGAMASDIRRELRADFKRFPPFSGANTHYPMDRRRLVG
jgi:uncharacterized protein (TIGR02118 family)